MTPDMEVGVNDVMMNNAFINDRIGLSQARAT